MAINTIKFHRSEKYLSKKELSKPTGIPIRRLRAIENGATPSTKDMLMLSNALEKPTEDLFPKLPFKTRRQFEQEKSQLEEIAKLEHRLLEIDFQHEKELNKQKAITKKVKEESHEKINELEEQILESDAGVLFRELNFPPGYQHAGMTIIQGFVELIRNKYSDKDILVTIEQNEHKVIMKIRMPDGETKEIEEDLRKFSLVIVGKEEISAITDDKLEILKLQNQLSIASLQVQQQREMANVLMSGHEQRIANLEEHNQWLREQLSTSLSTAPDTVNALIESVREHSELFKLLLELQTEASKDEKDAGAIKRLVMAASEVIAKEGVGAGVADVVKRVIAWASKKGET